MVWDPLAGTRVLDLAQPMRRGMPQSPNHPPFRMAIERRHGDVMRPDGGSAANELIVTGGHVGTHVDALAHVSQDGYLHGGVEALSVQGHLGFTALGIETFGVYVGRAAVFDVARLHGVPSLPPGYEITAADLAACDAEVRPGDAVLIGTGWSRRWDEPEAFVGHRAGCPGPGVEAAGWLVERGAAIAGGETIAFECIPPGAGHAVLPVHRLLLVERGIHIVETMRLAPLLDTGATECLLVLNPLPIVGATGAPVRPLAVLP
ncbi:cyclase family protein [Dactylosporangium sucinum]|uniref:Cyclase n=1 Tax=Dactylosporangium sucinum TaxID=1424081 RepID=A0A917T178_9ACTN|nr:cyclase family protein [Dactylosporangium sucinum]GGM05751.1 cyclase [Dactylosporangium sucinum]